MSDTVRRFERPYSEDDEAHVFFQTFHKCQGALDRLNAEGGEAARWCDALLFPVGAVGFGMPRDQIFPVPSTEPCGGCGKIVMVPCAWSSSKIIDFGAFPQKDVSG